MIPDLRNTEHHVMNGTVQPRPETKPAVEESSDEACATCPHPWHSHDRIAARYCTASAAGGRPDRGCVCTTTKEI